jgi:hypothetical protein
VTRLLFVGLLLGLCSCREIAIAHYRDEGVQDRTVHEPGFDYQILLSVLNDEPWRQRVGLFLRPRTNEVIELVDLRATLKWMEGARIHTVVPYREFEIDTSVPDAKPFSYADAVGMERTTFDLGRLASAVPAELRKLGPGRGARRVYSVYFAQSDCRCIPREIDRIAVELKFAIAIKGQVRTFTSTADLRPQRETSWEFYNFKSGAFSGSRCPVPRGARAR